MTPQYHPFLVNGRFGDPVVYVDFRFSKRGILFDLGNIAALPTRKILRISDVFVSHMHVDHLIGFDRMLEILLGRPRRVRLFGPKGLVDAVGHKLAAYTWNLAQRVPGNLTFVVTETDEDGRSQRAEFAISTHFAKREVHRFTLGDDVVHEEAGLVVRRASLDHGIPCVAYALREHVHINIWKNRLKELGLGRGPWLNALKESVLRGDPDDSVVHAAWETPSGIERRDMPLGLLRRECLSITPGQKIAYVTDASHSEANQSKIVDLARDADHLFIECAFADEDAALARDRHHLTASQAGTLARRAGARRAEAMHISTRYKDCEPRILDQFSCAFSGG